MSYTQLLSLFRIYYIKLEDSNLNKRNKINILKFLITFLISLIFQIDSTKPKAKEQAGLSC